MSKPKLHPDVVAIKRAAPKWANYFGVSPNGNIFWNSSSANWSTWTTGDNVNARFEQDYHGAIAGITNYGVNLRTGAVRLWEAGKIVSVPQSAWVAARKRKSRK